MKRDAILTIKLPVAGGRLEDYSVREPRQFERQLVIIPAREL